LGGIDLTRALADEYEQLRAAGYPLIYKNVPRQLAEGVLSALPIQYLIEGENSRATSSGKAVG
jgi:hypothetical protein